jgi:acetyl esterase/lipase
MAPDWTANMEIGIRFWRHQFTAAMTHKDIRVGRALYNSLHTRTDDVYAVQTEPAEGGVWMRPQTVTTDRVLLYFHGGGYTFGGPNADRFAAMLSHHTGARLFMPHYRRTPEHPHPAQADDALSAWTDLRRSFAADNIVLIGDSAGAHMALMLLQALRQRGQAQPALCIALCPWVDIGDRGGSLHENDPFDLVQGWMAVQFGAWLDPQGRYGRTALSPICQNYKGLAPIYLQAGGREIFRDPALDFAQIQAAHGADILFDLWADMPHDFQAYDSMFASSRQALCRIHAAVHAGEGLAAALPVVDGVTRVRGGVFDPES